MVVNRRPSIDRSRTIIEDWQTLILQLSLLARGIATFWVGSLWLRTRHPRLILLPLLFGVLTLQVAIEETVGGGALLIGALIDLVMLSFAALLGGLMRSRKHTEEALRESESRLRLVVRNAPIILFAIDSEGKLTFSDGQPLATLGSSPGEMVGQNAFEVYAGEEGTVEHLRAALEGEERAWTAQVGERCFDTRALPLRQGDGTVVGATGIAIDVSDRMEAASALRESEAKFALAFRSSPDAISITTLPRGRLLDLNEGFVELTGISREAAIGRTAESLDLWDDLDERAAIIGALLEGRTVRGEEMHLRRSDGEVRLCEVSAEVLDLDGQPILLSVVRDISERKKAEKALRASEAKFAKAFQASPDAILITSVPQGKIVEVNEGFARITRYSREAAIGRTTRDLGIWVDLDERDQMLDAIRRYQRVRDMGIQIRDSRGKHKHCVLSGELIALGEERFLLTVVRDVSEREAFVRELEAKNAELERFTYTVSHDLKSPLVTIRGFLGLLEKDAAAGDQERVARDIARINAASDTMAQLLDDLLELSRIGRMANPPETIDLGDMAQHLHQVLAGPIEQRGAELVIEPGLPTVTADRPRLWEVLQNLVENAIKFSGEVESPRIVVDHRHAAGEDVITVGDNGIGIAPEHHEKVFGLFARLDPKVEGTGIGLALVKRIIEVHDGRIWVESEGLGKGSTFCFTLAGGADQDGAQGGGSVSSGDSSP